MNIRRIHSRTAALIIGVVVILLVAAAWWFHRPEQVPSVFSERTPDERPIPPGMKEYHHPTHRFALHIPEDMEVAYHREDGGAKTVVFTMPGDTTREFQMYIVPYTGETITSSQIAKDTHTTAIGTPADVVLGGGTSALIFESEHPMTGRLREVWFLMHGHLFEVTTYAGNDEWLASILETLTPISI